MSSSISGSGSASFGPWLIQGSDSDWYKVIDDSSTAADCDDCPCGGCRRDVEARVRELTRPCGSDSGQSDSVQSDSVQSDSGYPSCGWTEVSRLSPEWSCADWSDSSLVQPASGRLAVAFPRPDFGVGEPDWVSPPALFVFAVHLYHEGTGKHLTVGCQCTEEDGKCSLEYAEYPGYALAGTVPVRPPEDVSDSGSGSASSSASSPVYLPEWACQGDPCAVIDLRIQDVHGWHGGDLYGEGYQDWWLINPGTSEPNINSYGWRAFRRALVYPGESDSISSGQTIAWLDCDECVLSVRALDGGREAHALEGACSLTENCATRMLMWCRWLTGLDDGAGHPIWELKKTLVGDWDCENQVRVSGTLCATGWWPVDGELRTEMVQGPTHYWHMVGEVMGTQWHPSMAGRPRVFGCRCDYYYSVRCRLDEWYDQGDEFILGYVKSWGYVDHPCSCTYSSEILTTLLGYAERFPPAVYIGPDHAMGRDGIDPLDTWDGNVRAYYRRWHSGDQEWIWDHRPGLAAALFTNGYGGQTLMSYISCDRTALNSSLRDPENCYIADWPGACSE